MRTIHDRTFHVGVPALLKQNAIVASHVLKMFIEKYLALIRAYPYVSPRR